MNPNKLRLIACVAALLSAAGAAGAQEIVSTPAKPFSIYRAGEKIAWQIEVRGQDAAAVTEIRYVLKKNGAQVMREGTLPLADGKATLETSLDEPGAVLGDLRAKAPKGEIKALVGAAVEPEKIRPSAPRPDDFDAFWKAKLADLAAVPANPVLEPAACARPGVDYYKIRMDNIRGSHIYGQLARPKREGKFPALLIVQWAGVYPLAPDWVTSRAEQGWLALNIMAHDLPFDQPADFYKKAMDDGLNAYTSIGNTDRETSYFLRMYLSCYRAAEYLAGRPDWDGRTLVVTGTSQGGCQTIVTAALEPKITAALACVPAGCDTTAQQAGRAFGWPYWQAGARGKDGDKIMQTSRYYDVVNFASRVKCPTLVGLGLVDTTCPPTAVFSMLNQLAGPKEAVVEPPAGHQGPHGPYNARSAAWFRELAQGKTPAIPAEWWKAVEAAK